MALTPLRKNGVDKSKLSDKQWRYCQEYCIDGNGTRSAIAAGYGTAGAPKASSRLLKQYNVKAMIGKIQGLQSEKYTIQRDEILMHLAACATREAKDFVDEDGHLLIDNINDLPDAVSFAVDTIKQRKYVRTDKDGSTTTTYEWDVKLADKMKALHMAMEHKGLFAATAVEHTIQFPWDQINGPPDAHDPIEQKILDVESKAIEGNGKPKIGSNGQNGNGQKP